MADSNETKMQFEKSLHSVEKRFRDVLIASSSFFFEFDLSDGVVHEGYHVGKDYEDVYDVDGDMPKRYDELYPARKDKFHIETLNPGDEKYWTCACLAKEFSAGNMVVEFEYRAKTIGKFWRAQILLSENDDGTVHAVYICRDITKSKLKSKKELAYRATISKFLQRYCEAAISLDLATGQFEIISSIENFDGPKTGLVGQVASYYEDVLLPEFIDEFKANMTLENIQRRLRENDHFSFNIYLKDQDGNVHRLLHSFYAIDEERHSALVIRQDTTESYLKEQKIARIRENVSANAIPENSYLRSIAAANEGRHKILVVEDNEINREIIKEILGPKYDILEAENGLDGIEELKKHRQEIDLVILDVYMPVCNGFDFLEIVRKDPALSVIPIIVATSSNKPEDEEKCLRLGASDFVQKPYNQESLLGRVGNAIALSESVSALSSVEFDLYTGFYTTPAFLHHARKKLDESSDDFDLTETYIRDYAMIKNIHGERTALNTFKYITDNLMEYMPDAIWARRGDKLFSLSPMTERGLVAGLPDKIAELIKTSQVPNMSVKTGIYLNVDKKESVNTMCERAKMAIDSVQGNYDRTFAFFDEEMLAKKMRDQQLLSFFDEALLNRQFFFYLQPKVDSLSGRIVGAEALVRWKDENGNLVSPGSFVPLFEKEGCIIRLDEYIFREVCRYQKGRAENGFRIVPISVNLSRNSLFSNDIVGRYKSIVESERVDFDCVALEITESAATSDEKILSICNDFVKAGFRLHMDDFGTGYSSLSSLSTLPFSVMKLDKTIIDKIGTEKGEVILKNIIDTAQDLGMEIVAEGVETEQQIAFLTTRECTHIQGYFYSKPLPVPQFDQLVAEEAPFFNDKQSLYLPDVPRLSSADLKRYLRFCKSLFTYVRVLDKDFKGYFVANDEGEIGTRQECCYNHWKRDIRCVNCAARKAIAGEKIERKIEVIDNQIHIMYCRFVLIDGEPRVIELVNVVGTDTLSSFRDNAESVKKIYDPFAVSKSE